MEPIDLFGASGFLQHNRERRRVEKKSDRPVEFSSLLSSAADEGAASAGASLDESGATLEALLDRVHETGQQVRDGASFVTVQHYKDAVRGFVAYVVRHALGLEERESGLSIRRRKRFTLLRIIDRKLERFAADILAGQRDQLAIAMRIDEINGLLVDLLT